MEIKKDMTAGQTLLLTPQQLRMARAGLGMNVRELAQLAEVAPYTITRFETGRGGMHRRTMTAIREALENSGIEFLPGNGHGPGVRLKNRHDAANADAAAATQS